HPRAPSPAGDLFSLGAALNAAGAGRSPFAAADEHAVETALRETAPERPERAGALAALILQLLEKDPARRASAETARLELEGVRAELTRSVARPEDTGTGGPVAPPPPGDAAGPQPDGGSGSKKRRVRWLTAIIAAAAVIVLGGVAAALVLITDDGGDDRSAHKPPTTSASASPTPSRSQGSGSAFPYGQQAGLSKALVTGDCVNAVWPEEPLTSVPNLGPADCATGSNTNAQVIATMYYPSAEDARRNASQDCAKQMKDLVGELPDAGSYALVPTDEGFARTDGSAACLAAAKHGSFGGEVGPFRDDGSQLNPAQAAIGDCWNSKQVKDAFDFRLASCERSHTDQVVGFVQAPSGMSYDKAVKTMGELCGNRFTSQWATGSDRQIWGNLDSPSRWNQGFRYIVCTVSLPDREATSERMEPEAPDSTPTTATP
ncbi:septum formation family protein, partial [Streptomyces sp. NPDC057654]|uniref:septum formation family protein n=1 Tax=Streptomyces sp. NPDC057654 TaxID=3346196 RepID=UPI003692FBA1